MGQINRRAALIGAAISTAALAAPAVTATQPSKGDELQAFLDTASPEDLIQYHANKLAEALCKVRPGLWRFNLTDITSPEHRGILLFHRRKSQFVGYAQDFT